jgi:hypothetical protein
MLLVGLAGSLTTMSALSIESVEMLSVGHYSQALINILLNLLLSLMAASLGVVRFKIFIEFSLRPSLLSTSSKSVEEILIPYCLSSSLMQGRAGHINLSDEITDDIKTNKDKPFIN